MSAPPLSSSALMNISPVIPVVVLEHAADAVPLAEALLRGGVGVMEITLRTPVALDAVRLVASEVPDMVVGAGSVLEPRQVEAAQVAGARFLVSPGATPGLGTSAIASGLPWLPGVNTVSEVLRMLDLGQTGLKFFPAEASGGRDYLAAVAGPVPQATFCPTGGITQPTAASWLALPNVPCVGGSWLTPTAAVQAGAWDIIESLARQATGDGLEGNAK